MKESLEFAVDHIARFGDTDIFPYSHEKKIFNDKRKDSLSLLQKIHKDFSKLIETHPPYNQSTLCPVGYSGFRWATQIDSFWDAYLLSLTIKLGEKIEEKRISKEEEYVFSYRFQPDPEEFKLFDPEFNWIRFQKQSLKLCEEYKYVLLCDISDFYSRIYHHRLENSLQKLNVKCDTGSRILKILSKFSEGKSYGLPIGGNSARILAELVLNSTDKLLKTEQIRFCRYVDDYHIFTNSKEEAYKHLITLSEFLLENEGLSLQKSKTRIMLADEFKQNSDIYDRLRDSKDPKNQFLSLSLNYDPYSPTAKQDYLELKGEMNRFDILGLLKAELNEKSKIHKPLVTKLLSAINLLESEVKFEAVLTLLDNLQILTPVFSQIMLLVLKLTPDFNMKEREEVFKKLIENIQNKNHLFEIELNLHYVILILGVEWTEENEQVLNRIYKSKVSEQIKKDIILIMAKWGYREWISNLKSKFNTMGRLERRSFLVASYILGDEGGHWRSVYNDTLDEFEKISKNWGAELKSSKRGFDGVI